MKATEKRVRKALEMKKESAESPMVQAVIEALLKRKDLLILITNIVEDEGSNTYFPDDNDARNFFYAHRMEIDTMLREYDNTSIAEMIMAFFDEMHTTLAYAGFDHTVRRVLENIDIKIHKK